MIRTDDEATFVTWLDTALLLLGGFVLMTVLLVTMANPAKKKEDEGARPPGNILFAIRWADEIDADIDLWVQAPGDVPVGYSSKSGKVANLLRDDLGKRGDMANLNYENAFARGIPPGTYCANAHAYSTSTVQYYPIKVYFEVVLQPDDKSSRVIESGSAELKFTGEEITLACFEIGQDKEVVPGSMNHLNKPIRSRAK
jgi:hypothetical protein